MTKAAPPFRENELRWLTLGMAATLLPIATLLPLWVPALAAAFALWRLVPGWLGRQRAPLAFLRLPLGLFCFASVYLEFGNLNGIEPGTSLLVLMLGLKLLETWKYRDSLILTMLAYVLLLAVFLSNQDLPVALWLTAVCCFQTAVLLRLTRLGEPGPLKPSVLTAGKLLLQALPIALILFVLFPRVPGPLWGTPTPEHRATTGLSDRMHPGAISELAQSDALAFRVRFPDDNAPDSGQRYWRGPVFHDFDGQEWREGRAPPRQPSLIPVGDTIQQEITLEPHYQDWLFALEMPGGELPDDSDLQTDMRLTAKERISERRRYQVDSWPNYVLDQSLSADWQDRLSHLPEDSNPQTQTLAQEWMAEADHDPRTFIDRVLTHFNQESFYYTLEPPRLGRQAMDEFLFETRRGFCEHYAGALAVLTRAAGIPTRVVTGYQGAQYNPMAGHYRVLQSNAHAWNEVWLEEEGWIRVDPTTAIHPSRVESQVGGARGGEDGDDEWADEFSWQRLNLQVEMMWDTLQARWDGWFLAYGPENQQQFLEKLGLPGRDALRLAIIMILLVAGAGLLLWLGLSLQQRPPRPKDPMEKAWRDFQQRMARAGFPKHPHEGPASWQARLEAEAPRLARVTAPIMNRFRRARYADADARSDRLRRQIRRLSRHRLRQLARN